MKRLLPLVLLCAIGASAQAALMNNIEYAKADGESLKLDAFVPDGDGPFPAVILIHGGGWDSGDKAGGSHRELIAPMEDPLSQAGFAWFSINYRLAPKHPFPACFDDVETAIRWVRAHATAYHLDPDRIAISGESAGGHLAALAAVRADKDTRVDAVVDFYGRVDLLADGLSNHGKLSGNLAQLFGSTKVDEHTEALMREASPLDQIHPGLPPFLFLHGTDDHQVPYRESVKMLTQLTAVGVPCDLISIPKGPHGMYGWAKIAPEYKGEVVAWLRRTMPPHPWRYRIHKLLGI
jgi:acetyl esterase/lipase